MLACFLKKLGSRLFSRLSSESDCENIILNTLQHFSEPSKIHRNLLLKVVSTLHALKDVFGYVEQVTVRVLDSDAIACDLFDLKVGSLREPLLCLKLFSIP